MSAAQRELWTLLAGGLALSSVACSGEPLTQASGQPLRVLDAQFREAALPGSRPLSNDEVNTGVAPQRPTVTSTSLANALIPAGEPGRSFNGRTTPDAAAIGVRLAGLGSGYFVLPTRNADVVNDGELEWSFRAAFARDIPAGKQRLLFAAIDAGGHAGTQVELNLCISPEIPDNGNACDQATAPPALVVSLGWSEAVDLDLRVLTPNGKIVDSKHPSTESEDASGHVDPKAEGAGLIGYDSFAHCSDDGRRREDLVFQSSPPSGTYLVYANLYDACGQPGAHFDASLQRAVAGDAPDSFAVEETYHQTGELEAAQANGGAGLGLFVTSFVVD
jgi:hypothetical protein